MANKLIGKTLLDVRVADNKESITFHTTEGDVTAITDAECCSTTWIEHVEVLCLSFPAVVTAVENLDMGKEPSEIEYGDVVVYYGCKVSTDKGEIVIDYRNRNNGYYGGDLRWPE
jgi:hypothetical protein